MFILHCQLCTTDSYFYPCHYDIVLVTVASLCAWKLRVKKLLVLFFLFKIAEAPCKFIGTWELSLPILEKCGWIFDRDYTVSAHQSWSVVTWPEIIFTNYYSLTNKFFQSLYTWCLFKNMFFITFLRISLMTEARYPRLSLYFSLAQSQDSFYPRNSLSFSR